MEPYVHRIKYYECDKMGVTHHSNYIRIMEEARIYVLDQLGYGFEKMEADGIVSPVISLSCDYKKTTTFQDEVEVYVKVVEMSRLKMTFGYEMKVKGTLVFKATSVHCFFGASGRPVSLQDVYPELVEAMQNL